MTLETRVEGVRVEGERRARKPSWVAAFTAMTLRQLLRFKTAKSRVVNSLVFPLIWLIFFGLGWSAVFSSSALGRGAELLSQKLFGGLTYLQFLAPGVIVMTVFMAGFGSGLGLLWDKEFGYFKEILVSPAPRSALITGRIFGDTLAAMLQGVVMALLVSAVAGWPSLAGLIGGLVAAFIAALASSAMGTLIALSMRSPEGFHIVINLLMLPMLFVSGAFYPIDPLPLWLKIFAYINPLYYAVDLTRGLMYNVYSSPSLLIDVAGLLAVTGAALAAAIAKFSKTYIA